MKSLLGIGECMLELSSVQNNLWQQTFAGDVFNALWYAKALSSDDKSIKFFTAIGDDHSSNEMLSFIKSSGVSCPGVPRVKNGAPGLYKIHLEGAERSFSYWRDTSAARQFMKEPNKLWTQVANADIVYLSGITMAILPDSDAEVLLAGLRAALKPGAMIAFDPNIRARLWASQERTKDIISRTAAISDLVLPSYEDEQLTFGDKTPMATAERYQALGVKQIIVKNAENESLFAEADRREFFPVTKVNDVIDTTAAGDSFNGAYLAEYMASGDISRSISLAQKCAATVICERGALIPFEMVQTIRSAVN